MNSSLRSPKRKDPEREIPPLVKTPSIPTLPLIVEDNDLSKKLKSRLYSSNPLVTKGNVSPNQDIKRLIESDSRSDNRKRLCNFMYFCND